MPFYPRVRFARLETPRLILRSFEERDITAFTAYRSDPEVARYQGWEAPFPPDTLGAPDGAKAAHFVIEMIQARPGTPGAWYQAAIELKADGDAILKDTLAVYARYATRRRRTSCRASVPRQ